MQGVRASSWKGKEFSRRWFPGSCLSYVELGEGRVEEEKGVPRDHRHSSSRAHLPGSTCGLDARPRPHARPEPRPWWGGESRRGRGPPPRPAEPMRRCGLRRRVTRGGEWAAGRRYRLPASTPGPELGGAAPAGSEAGRAGWPRRPAPLRQARHAGPRREREPRAPGRAALHRRVRGGPLRERRAHAQFRHLPAGAARRRGLQHIDA